MTREAGELRIPFTSGLLIGIGETAEERIETILTIRELHREHGHIGEVIVQNFRPGVADRIGIGEAAAREINPKIIYAGVFGYGQDGPYAAKPAFDDLIQGAVAIPSFARIAAGGCGAAGDREGQQGQSRSTRWPRWPGGAGRCLLPVDKGRTWRTSRLCPGRD